MKSKSYNIVKEGYLIKESLHFKQLRKRWIVLHKRYMDCFKDNALLDPTETFDLSKFDGIRISVDGKPGQFELFSNKTNSGSTPKRIFIASSTEDMNDWIKNIRYCMAKNHSKKHNNNKRRKHAMDYKDGTKIPNKYNDIKSKSTKKHNSTQQIYTESDIKEITLWYTQELEILRKNHVKEKNALLLQIENLQNELDEIKQNKSTEIERKWRKISKDKDKRYNEMKSYVGKLESDCIELQNELLLCQQNGDEKSNDYEFEGKVNGIKQCEYNENNSIQRGLLIFQRDCMNERQLKDMNNYYISNIEASPKIIFGDNDIDKMGKYDKTICYGITSIFHSCDIPTLYGFRILMNKQFEILKQHLLNGYDVIIPLPTSKDIEINGINKFYKFNKQIIYHKIGIGIAKLPFSYIEYIQNKIDELTKYAYSTQIVECYNYDRNNYKQIVNLMNDTMFEYEIKTKKKKKKRRFEEKTEELKYCIIWQWKNNKNKWISYDYKTCKKIEILPINGIYEYTTNSFIAKISKIGGIHVNIATEVKREIRRIKKEEKQKQNQKLKTKVVKKKEHTKIEEKMAILAKEAINKTKTQKKRVKKKEHTKIEEKMAILAKEAINKTKTQKKRFKETPENSRYNRWRTYSKEKTDKIESLQTRKPYEYTMDGKTYQITKQIRNFPETQSNLETFEKRHVEQTKTKEITNIKQEKKQKLKTEIEFLWQWMDNDKIWRPFDEETSTMIEHLVINRSYCYKYWGNKESYKITKLSPNKAIQLNIKTKIERNVRRIENASNLSHSKYPKFWDIKYNNYDKTKLIDLTLNKIYGFKIKQINNRFFESVDIDKYEIIKIEAIQNQMLYDKYLNERELMIKLIGKNKLNERHLFHATDNEDIMKLIENEGFQKEFNQISKYGEGTYFMRDANYFIHNASINKNGIYKIFQCKVICGQSILGNSSYSLKNWPKKQNGLIFDSLVDDEWNKSIFVIHQNIRAYPMFIIHFKKKKKSLYYLIN